jgi:hypothetical protein
MGKARLRAGVFGESQCRGAICMRCQRGGCFCGMSGLRRKSPDRERAGSIEKQKPIAEKRPDDRWCGAPSHLTLLQALL